MALPKDYTGQPCSLARALEVVGERWTLLILRDAFYGVRRFSDFLAHLEIPRAVLSDRLSALVAAGLLDRVAGPGGHDEYVTTSKGRELWPAMLSLMSWGDAYYAPQAGPRRVFHHAGCGGALGADGVCKQCGQRPALDDLIVSPGPGLSASQERSDPVSQAMTAPRQMLTPLTSR